MLWGLILQGLALVGSIMGALVEATYTFGLAPATGAAQNQWTGNVSAVLTPKGNSIVSSLLTIMHYGLDFVAQFTLLLPAQSSITYVTSTGANMLTTAAPK